MSQDSGKKNGNDSLILILVLITLFLATWVAIWFSAHSTLAWYGLYFSWLSLKPFDISLFPSISAIRNEIAQLAAHPQQVSFSQLWDVLGWAGRFYLPLPLSLTVCAIIFSLRHRSQKITRGLTADTLPWVMSKHAPAIIPVLQIGDLLNSNPKGHESRRTPVEFAQLHKLINATGHLNIERCRDVFSKQMGEKISNLKELKPYERALFATFSLRVFGAAREAPEAQRMLDALNRSCRKGIPDYSVVSDAVERFIDDDDAKKLVRFFPYASTLLLYLHREACKRGRMPSSHFRWLKPVDRPLWYALNASGRATPCVESIAQYQNFRWQEWAMDEGRVMKQIYLDDVIACFKTILENEGMLLVPVSSFKTSSEIADEN